MPFTIRELNRPFAVLHWGIDIAVWNDGVNTRWNDACEDAANVDRIAEEIENLSQEAYEKRAIERRDEAIRKGELELVIENLREQPDLKTANMAEISSATSSVLCDAQEISPENHQKVK